MFSYLASLALSKEDPGGHINVTVQPVLARHIEEKKRTTTYTQNQVSAACLFVCALVPFLYMRSSPCSWSWLASSHESAAVQPEFWLCAGARSLTSSRPCGSRPSCGTCGTLRHLVLECPAYVTQHTSPIKECRRPGLQRAALADYLFSKGECC